MSLWLAALALADPEVFKKTNTHKRRGHLQKPLTWPFVFSLLLPFLCLVLCIVILSPCCFGRWYIWFPHIGAKTGLDLNTDPNPRFWFSTAAPGVLVPQSVRVFTLEGVCCFC